MNYIQAIEAVKLGKKIRRRGWMLHIYWYIDVDQIKLSGEGIPATAFTDNILADDWLIINDKPVISPEERKYIQYLALDICNYGYGMPTLATEKQIELAKKLADSLNASLQTFFDKSDLTT